MSRIGIEMARRELSVLIGSLTDEHLREHAQLALDHLSSEAAPTPHDPAVCPAFDGCNDASGAAPTECSGCGMTLAACNAVVPWRICCPDCSHSGHRSARLTQTRTLGEAG